MMCIYDVYGHDVVSVWHEADSNVFQSGNFDFENAPRSGRSITVEKSMKSWKKLSKTGTLTSHDIGKERNIDHKTVSNHLEKVGYKKSSMSHDLTCYKNFTNRIFLATRQKLKEFCWKVSMHPSYSLALSDYHLFRSLQNSLNGVKLT